MESCKQKSTFVDLSAIADEINQYRSCISGDKSQETFEANVNMVKSIIKSIFAPNDDLLINILSYDAYKFFIESKNDVTAERSVDGYLDMSVHNGKNVSNGYLTKYHVLDDGEYYGSFHIEYVADNGFSVSRDFIFEKNSLDDNYLTITNTINGKSYIELVYIEDGQVLYHVMGTDDRFSGTRDSLKQLVAESDSEDVTLMFPELFQEDYFKDYEAVQRKLA